MLASRGREPARPMKYNGNFTRSALMDSPAVLARVRARPWFYEFDLPDGSVTTTYLPPGVAAIHTTRLAMLWRALARDRFDDLRVVDVACHQGYFATHLARKGCREVVAIDARAEHIADVTLIAQAYGLANVRTMQA